VDRWLVLALGRTAHKFAKVDLAQLGKKHQLTCQQLWQRRLFSQGSRGKLQLLIQVQQGAPLHENGNAASNHPRVQQHTQDGQVRKQMTKKTLRAKSPHQGHHV
jgi:hypothetical protein